MAEMKWFLGTYTGRFNRRHRMFGHLFSGRYKSLIVDGSGTGYLRTVCEYVHTGARFGRVVSVTVRGDQSALVDDPAATAAHATLGGGIIQSIKGTLLKFPYISVLPTRPNKSSLQFQ